MYLCTGSYIFGQERATPPRPRATSVSVPFVGCESDGQAGPADAPTSKPISLQLGVAVARQLAYYESAQGIHVLGPRGWYCFGIYGSSGESLVVSSQPIDSASVFTVRGPAIEVSHREGQGSGALEVAEVMARVFPDFKAFATNIAQGFGMPISFGPYPKDELTYLGKRVVEYKTPAQTEGLGTHISLKKNGRPIEGVAMLVGQPPDLVLLSVRLPPNLRGLTATIIRQVEADAATASQ
jgi:hypothetical protein